MSGARPRSSVPGAARSPEAPPRDVVLLGVGTVGGGVFGHLLRHADAFRLRGALVREPAKPRGPWVDRRLLTTRWEELARFRDAVVVEVAGGLEPARRWVAEALSRGQPVVTANKELMERHGPELQELAAVSGAPLRYGAAVGGACPMVELVEREAARTRPQGEGPGDGEVVELRGVLNGTCNWVLDRVADGLSPRAAVDEAVRRGFAEADPHADLTGLDAARKLALLARLAFGRRFGADAVATEELDPSAPVPRRPPGRVLRQVARCRRGKAGGLEASVRIEALPDDDPLARLRGEWNGLIVTRRDGSEASVRGRGAGRWPTAEAVMRDLLALRSSAAAPGPLFPETGADREGNP